MGYIKDWHNIITSSEETIQLVDQRWPDYGAGLFAASPSRAYRLGFIGE